MRRQSGFTLIELLVALATLAIVVGLGAPGLRDFMMNNRRVAAVNEMVASLALSRSEAVARNLTVSMCPSTNGTACAVGDWDQGWIVFSDNDGDGTVDAGVDTVIKAIEELPTLTVTTPDLGTSVTYRPNGRVRAQGQLVFCDSRGSDQSRVVQLDIVGRPVVSDKLRGGGTPSCG
jgi:type IV fimbrial biogenesis protein FimT